MPKLLSPQFRHVALIGKYHASAGLAARDILLDIARFLEKTGLEVSMEKDTAANAGITQYPSLSVAGIGEHCDLGLVVGGDGTMLGIGRQLARYGVPLIGINQGRLGFITDIALDELPNRPRPHAARGIYRRQPQPDACAGHARWSLCV